MKEELLGEAIALVQNKKKLTATIASVSRVSDERIELFIFGDGVRVDRVRYLTFLDGEIQAINLQLHRLGVELPGVPTINGVRQVTKGQDQ